MASRSRLASVHHSSDSSNSNDYDFSTYTIQLPPTPDNQPMEVALERSSSWRVEDQYASGSIFVGGYNNVTHAHWKEKSD